MKSLRLLGLHTNEVLLGPQSVHIDITNSCNTNCVTCWDHSPHLKSVRSPAWKRQRAELERVENLLQDIDQLGGLEAVILSGMGEPFTHPHVYDMIAAVKKRGLHLTIITNLIAADLERLHQLGVDTLLIGVQGASQESYRAFHPSFVLDEWQQLLDKLKRAQQLGRRDKHVQVICSHNAHEITDMVEMAACYGASQLNFKLASLRDGTEAVQLSGIQRQWLIEEGVPKAQRRSEQLGQSTNLSAFAQQLKAGLDSDTGLDTANIREVGCYMGHYYARILVDGTVLYCCNVEVEVGKLGPEQPTFAELWRGQRWNDLRQSLRQGHYFNNCHQCGKFNQNLKVAEKFAKVYGRQRLLEISGR